MFSRGATATRRLVLHSSSYATKARALVYSNPGAPAEVLRASSFDNAPLQPSEVALKVLMAPLNPVDMNVVQGVYPRSSLRQKDVHGEDIFVGGNEGLAEVLSLGPGVEGDKLKVGDWVNFDQHWEKGTWRSHVTADASQIIPIPRSLGSKITEAQGATLAINPATAYRMLHDFVKLKKGDIIVQNGANSGVAKFVIPLCKKMGVETINFVRDREDIDDLKSELKAVGATYVFTYTDLADRKEFPRKIEQILGKRELKLALNCVSGSDTTNMSWLLAKKAFLVTYGGMSRKPLSLPSGHFIFRNLSSVGFGIATWYNDNTLEERAKMTKELVELMEDGTLPPPDAEIVVAKKSLTDEELGVLGRELGKRGMEGFGKKLLLKFE